ncbi:hypothetical protein [Pelolinea submarina]|uniref:Uncharacterized protein n=1 Tax=Pelolinea submarina TaxID=913107 RepID=A0A347ZVX5_9CHLR|nr:hypothetical protein [Pelolinea submarina]REG07153.1 hypothetical protein DFR64_2357 [Pelolinea submarina]BBB49456.1 hypothetical protein Pelsub_P2687 [Pelolinea submarina]
MMQKVIRTLNFAAASCLVLLLITTSIWQPVNPEDVIRPATRPYEFDYLAWTVGAFWNKSAVASLGISHYSSFYQDRQIIKGYFTLLKDNEELKNEIEKLYTNPDVEDPKLESTAMQVELQSNQKKLDQQSSLAEAVIQKQISITLDRLGLTSLRQPFPPVLYHSTELPKELIISQRNVIEQVASVSLRADMSLDEMNALEDEVEADSDYSALVVDVGGVGTYPTMVIRTSSISYLIETVAHEWTHNYLNLRPLGIRYSSSPELRTMNETTASIAGEEISQAVTRYFYADLLDTPNTPYKTYEAKYVVESPPPGGWVNVDFRKEMYQTRVHVDELLAAGQITEAESYMEERRQLFWSQGFSIRKLNQAYFAFHGAYADQEYSAAGEDPVGSAVRSLRARSSSLADFIKKMSSFSSYDQLSKVVNAY